MQAKLLQLLFNLSPVSSLSQGGASLPPLSLDWAFPCVWEVWRPRDLFPCELQDKALSLARPLMAYEGECCTLGTWPGLCHSLVDVAELAPRPVISTPDSEARFLERAGQALSFHGPTLVGGWAQGRPQGQAV